MCPVLICKIDVSLSWCLTNCAKGDQQLLHLENMRALRIDEQTCLGFARWYQGWAIIDQVVPNIRSCQISDQQNDNSFQIVEGIFPSLFLWTTVVSEDISNVAWNRWTFYLWIQKHICYELWISIMGPMAFPFYWEMKICGKCRAKNLEAFIDWQWWAVWRGTDKFLRLVPIFWPETKHCWNFSSKFGSISRF